MGKKNFYAVKRGNGGPAIYTTWPECEARVKGFQGAVFKGFVTRAEAQAFLDGSAGPAAAAAPAAKKAKGSGSGVAPSRPLPFTAPAGTAAAASSARPEPRLMSGNAPASSGGGIVPGELAIFTDGACAGNQNVATTHNPAGWGACVVEGATSGPPPQYRPVGGAAIAELFGPVDLNASSPHYLGAEVASNNTGELSAICEALRWLIKHEP
jgi:hypothetical protein